METGPSNGSVSLDSNGMFTYTSNGNYHGTDSFSYGVSDGHGGTATAMVSFTISQVNDAPAAENDDFQVDEDNSLLGNVASNDTDVDGDELIYVILNDVSNGSLELNFDGTFTYTPNANFYGTDTFTYEAHDFNGDLSTATVTIAVNPVNDAPVANDSNFSTDEDTAYSGNVTATDVDGPALIYNVGSGPANGSLILNVDGSFTYSPNANFNGSDSFTFQVNDGSLPSNIATMTITVNPINDAPVANDSSLSTDEDTTYIGSVTATDIDGPALTYSASSGPANGTLNLNADGSFSYTPNANFNGSDSFTFQANDGSLTSNIATVTITVNSVNDAPIANDGSFSTDEDTAYSGSVTASDIDGPGLTYSVSSGPMNGTLNSGEFRYIDPQSPLEPCHNRESASDSILY